VSDASSDLLDAAFDLSIHAFTAAQHANARNRLWQDFPWIDLKSISEAYLAACRLHLFATSEIGKIRNLESTAYQPAEGHLSNLEVSAAARVREHCPGFAERT
jgi:hypothetical protein